MTKTLADMTEEERAECVGMWVSYQTPMGEHTAIYEAGTTLFEPGYGLFTIPMDCITPLRDKPRVWGADRRPPYGEWEYDYVASDGCAMSTGEYVDPKPGEKIRRWIGAWEEP